MSLLWFVFLLFAWDKGAEISDLELVMVSIFYVGDCILMRNRKVKDGKTD